MVSIKTIKEYDFESIDQYFDYISESIINGQRTQAKKLIYKLSEKQKKEAYNYFNNDYSTFFGEAKQMVIEAM